jgi:dipeptidyl-peptidase-3
VTRRYALERCGPALAVQYYADGFDALSPREKIFSYHLSRAAVAGRDIAVRQHHPLGIEVRDLFENLLRRPVDAGRGTLTTISGYCKLLWINNGFYDNLTSHKFLPECSFEEAQEACLTNGSGEKFEQLKDLIFSPSVDPVLTDKTPGVDWIRASAVNYYDRQLTLAQVQRWAEQGKERYPLNSTVVLRDGKIVEDVWRAGDARHAPGPYAAELRRVIRHLEDAAPFAASPYQEETIRKLVTFLRTGDNGDFRDYNIHWVMDDSRVDFNLGFIEVYLDPRNQKGEWQTSVYMTNDAQTKLMRALAAEAQYFEDCGPWSREFRKHTGRVPVANAVDAIIQTGGTGPVSPVGINLPNEQSVRQRYGSKSILLENIDDAADQAMGHALVREFGFDDEEIGEEIRLGPAADKLHTALHEVIGHGSGRMKAGLEETNPSDLLPGYYSTIEEARADCVALWFANDPKLLEIGAAPDAESLRAIAATMYRQMFRGALTQLRQIGDHTRLEEDHMKNRQLIAHYVLKNSAGVTVEQRDGKTFYRLADHAMARECVGTLLAELTRIKGEGDLAGAKRLVDTYGLHVDMRLRDEVRSRAERLNLPLYIGFVQPNLDPVYDYAGRLSDVTMTYPQDLASQMLGYSRASGSQS